MNIAVLTSSRADFGIYLPLLKELKKESLFNLTIIAFGSHTSRLHGYTIEEVYDNGFSDVISISTTLGNDDENSITTSYALTVLKFADLWSIRQKYFDFVLCLGDRYEMSAAVQAGIPYGIKFCHIHGGETTLGAFDNIYRHQITLASKLHFPTTSIYRQKIENLIGSKENIYTVGSLSLQNIHIDEFPSHIELLAKFDMPDEPFILVTFHPETASLQSTGKSAEEMFIALDNLANHFHLLITMPNADTQGSVYRKKLYALKTARSGRITLSENLGKSFYFTAMRSCLMMLGNSSSGIIEAASFKKFVVNVGIRQLGRARSKNVIDCSFDREEIFTKSLQVSKLGTFKGRNIYYRKSPVEKIIKCLSKFK